MTKNRDFKLNAVAVALFAIYGPSLALADEVSELTEPDSFVSAGIGQWSKERPQFGIYDGMAENKTYGLFDASINKLDRETGTWLTFRGSNLGLDPRHLRLEYLRQGAFGVYLENTRITRNDPAAISSTLNGTGTTTQVVSTNAVPQPARPTDLWLRRGVTEVGISQQLTDGLDLAISFKNDEKEGNRHWSRGNTGEFLAEPIDNATRQFEATLSYTGERMQLSGGYYGSWFRTEHTLVDSIRNNAAVTTLGSHTFMSLPLNNEAHQLFFNGGLTITPTTRATLKLAYTEATQDERLPTSDIVIGGTPLANAQAPRNLDGKVATSLFQLGVTSRPLNNLSLMANLRRHDVDDKTPAARVVFGATDAASVNVAPYSYTTDTGTFEATYRMPWQLSLTGGVDLKRQDRPIPVVGALVTNQRKVPHRAEIEEDTYRLQLRRAVAENLNGSLTVSRADRSGSNFSLTDAAIQDLINPIHIADRVRDKVRLSMDWMPIESFNVQLIVEDSRDDYGTSPARALGLQEGKGALYALDASYTLNDDWRVTAWLSHDASEAVQRNSTLGTATNIKTASLSDTGDALGLGVRGKFGERIRVGGDLLWSENRSGFSEAVPVSLPANSSALPDVEAKVTRLSLFGEFALDRTADVRVDLAHERWESNDWQWRFANGSNYVYGTTTDGTTVIASPKQVSNFVGARYIYKFQ